MQSRKFGAEFTEAHQSMVEAVSRSVQLNGSLSTQVKFDSDADSEGSSVREERNDDDEVKVVSIADMLRRDDGEGGNDDHSELSSTEAQPVLLELQQPAKLEETELDDDDSFQSQTSENSLRSATIFETSAVPFRERRAYVPERKTTISFMNYVDSRRRSRADLNSGYPSRMSILKISGDIESKNKELGRFDTSTENRNLSVEYIRDPGYDPTLSRDSGRFDTSLDQRSKFSEYFKHGSVLASRSESVSTSRPSQYEKNRVESQEESSKSQRKKNIMFEIDGKIEDDLVSENSSYDRNVMDDSIYSGDSKGRSGGLLQIEGKMLSTSKSKSKKGNSLITSSNSNLIANQPEDNLHPFLLKLDPLNTKASSSNSSLLYPGGLMENNDSEVKASSLGESTMAAPAVLPIQMHQSNDKRPKELKLKAHSYLNVHVRDPSSNKNNKSNSKVPKSKQAVHNDTPQNYLMVSNSLDAQRGVNIDPAKDETKGFLSGHVVSINVGDFASATNYNLEDLDYVSAQHTGSNDAVVYNYQGNSGLNLPINQSNDPLHPQLVLGYLHGQHLLEHRIGNGSLNYDKNQLMSNLEGFLIKSREERMKRPLSDVNQRRYSSLIPKREDTICKQDEKVLEVASLKDLKSRGAMGTTEHIVQTAFPDSRQEKKGESKPLSAIEVFQIKPLEIKPRDENSFYKYFKHSPRSQKAKQIIGKTDWNIVYDHSNHPQECAPSPSSPKLNGKMTEKKSIMTTPLQPLLSQIEFVPIQPKTNPKENHITYDQIQEIPSKISMSDSLFSDDLHIAPSMSLAASPLTKGSNLQNNVKNNLSEIGKGDSVANNISNEMIRTYSSLLSPELEQTEKIAEHEIPEKKEEANNTLLIDTGLAESTNKIHEQFYHNTHLETDGDFLLSIRRQKFEYSYQLSDAISFQKKSFRNLQLPSKSPILSPSLPTSTFLTIVGSDQAVQSNHPLHRCHSPFTKLAPIPKEEVKNSLNSPIESLQYSFANSAPALNPQSGKSFSISVAPSPNSKKMGESQNLFDGKSTNGLPFRPLTSAKYSLPWLASTSVPLPTSNSTGSFSATILKNEVFQKDNLLNRSDPIQIWKEKLEFMKLSNSVDPEKNRIIVRQQQKYRQAFEEYSRKIASQQQ